MGGPNKSIISKNSTISCKTNGGSDRIELIDEHLFVEALALCALLEGKISEEKEVTE